MLTLCPPSVQWNSAKTRRTCQSSKCDCLHLSQLNGLPNCLVKFWKSSFRDALIADHPGQWTQQFINSYLFCFFAPGNFAVGKFGICHHSPTCINEVSMIFYETCLWMKLLVLKLANGTHAPLERAALHTVHVTVLLEGKTQPRLKCF